MRKHKRLGRGLDALLDISPGGNDATAPDGAVAEAAVELLEPGRYQPRGRVSEDSLHELADSIREQGVLQPLVVRPVGPGDDGVRRFEIVAGERRWRAARIAGLATVPVVVRDLDDQSALAVALIENLQREDLNPIDQARSLSRLAAEFNLTHEEVARAVGRSRAAVSNLLRLLDLHTDVRDLLADGSIDMGHARALLSLEPKRQVRMAHRICRGGWSVRQVEKAVRDLLSKAAADANDGATTDMQTRWLQEQMTRELGQKIALRPGRYGEYALRIAFRDLAQLQEVLHRIQALVGQVQSTAGPRARKVEK